MTAVSEQTAGRDDPGGKAAGYAALDAIEAQLDALTAMDVRALTGTQALDLAARLVAVTGRISGQRFAALAVGEDSGAWAKDGSRSMVDAVTSREGASFGAVKAEIVLARQLEAHLPLTAAALRDGEISADKAKILARYAPTSPARIAALAAPVSGEAKLLAKAKRLDAHQLKDVVLRWCASVDPAKDDQDYRDAAPTYGIEIKDTPQGCILPGTVSPETGELLRTAIRAINGVPAAGDTRSVSQRNADGLHGLARAVLDQGDHGTGAKVRPHVNVSVSYETLLAKANEVGVDPATFTETGQPLPRVLLDRLVCDGEFNRVIFGPKGVVLDVGRTQRIVDEHQRRGVIARDKECQHPNCHLPPRHCEVHHRIWWERGGSTSVEDSVLLCWHHHDWVHREDITITREDDQWVFRDRHGHEIR